MLIISADDFGKNTICTNRIMECFKKGRITSTNAMVFMEDSTRAASLVEMSDLEVGLHLNLTLPFSATNISETLREQQKKVGSYLTRHKLFQVIYNPFLRRSFNYLFSAQVREFLRLYGVGPNHYNGHHHMHLCANVMASKMIPNGARIRRTFTFKFLERNPFNFVYRLLLELWVSHRFVSTDAFYSITPIRDIKRLQGIICRAADEDIEIEVHPEDNGEMEFLLSERYKELLNCVRCGGFRHIKSGK
jgi:predicted glycoside hydrolase/deacetylase ChbG (UPF0249 family)